VQQTPNYIEAQDILNATNGGLTVILDLYPQAMGCEDDRRKKFKMREEKSASANLHKTTDGTWLVTDFGGDQVPRNAILSWMLERNVDFVTALREIAGKYGIAGREQEQSLIRAEYSEREAGPDDEEGKWNWDIRDSFTESEIEAIVSKNVLSFKNWKSNDEQKHQAAQTEISAKFKYYRWFSLISYSLTKNRKVMTFSATAEYPIFLIDEGSHKKLYQPKHPDKGKRFMYAGTKPKDFMHGLEQLETEYKERVRKAESEDQGDDDEDTKKKKKEVKLDEVILCSGGSDAINVALLGYQVIWLNSETAKLPERQYNNLTIKVEKLYQLQDIDPTGKRSAHELAMQYLDIYTIELPDELKLKRDSRGNPCKDVRDYLNHYRRKDFRKLVDTALPYRFWERKPAYEGRGDKQVFVGYKYIYDNVQANNFLMKNGFGRLWTGDKKTDWMYVQRVGNQVREIDADIVQDFIHDFLEERYFDKDLRNAMLQTSRLNDSSLSRLKVLDIDFTDYTRNSQFLFFLNKTVEVTPTQIIYHRPGTVNRFIWEDDLQQHRIDEPKEPPFIIKKNEFGSYEIEIINTDCLWLKYLIQTSRIHWRKEFEGERMEALLPLERDEYKQKYHCCIDGPNLTPEEIEEQKAHLINKLFTMGWHLHRYHDRTKAWFSYAMDNKINQDGRSHGGSGKSLLFDVALRRMMPKNFYINGRNPKLTENEHKYDGLTEHHRYVLIDDAHEYLKLDFFYTDITGDVQVNPKGKKPFTIPFEKAGKWAFTTNYTPRDLGPSTERRILYSVFSDYYHNKGESDDYLEFRDPKTDLGRTLFVDFDQADWNDFYQVMIHALQFFLTTDEKIRPAMENVNKRNLLSAMGNNFHEWAMAYFSEYSERLDRYFVREEAQKMFNLVNKTDISPQSFKERLKAYCRYYGYILNPKEYQDKKGAIIKKVDKRVYNSKTMQYEPIPDSTKEAKEVFFIQSRNELPDDPMKGWPSTEDKDDLPF
jgi:hypothetical protein